MTITTFTKVCTAILLLSAVSSCAEDPLEKTTVEGGHTITLRLSATMTPIPETKASAIPTRSDSEAEAVGFKYEMLSSDANQAATTPGFGIEAMPAEEEDSDVHFTTRALATKAPATLKNAYGLLFTSTGAFNGRAAIGTYTVGTPQDITFTDVKDPAATGCRLVIIANDNAAATTYVSNAGTGGFAGFSSTGTYADFQKLTLTSAVNQDIDVPYAGSATVNLSQSGIDETAEVSLSWMLAKITLNNHTFKITGGPDRSSITLYNAGERRFATQGNDDYTGTGKTLTTAFVEKTDGSNANSVTWYVGENIRSAVSSVTSGSDRNSSKAPANACYIRIGSGTSNIGNSPSIGQEYIVSSSSFTYDIYLGKSSVLSDFSLRRHTHYTISSEISGTVAAQEELAASDGRVTLTKTGGESAGLVVGRFGGASGYTTGTGDAPTIVGSYTKLLLLEPNTTRTTATDNVLKKWSTNTSTTYQTESRKYWDHTYTSAYIDKAADLAFDYCYNLTLGGVAIGTWYLPTQAQVMMMWSVFRGLQGNGSFANYSAFYANYYWSSTEGYANYTWRLDFDYGPNSYDTKTNTYRVRCVRDL